MAVFGSLPTVRAQLAASPAFSAAFDYVARCLSPESEEHRRILDVANGATERVELSHGMFALEQAYVAKPREQGRWEAHREYIDIQVIVTGRELMELTDTGNLVVDEDFTPGRDLIFFQPYANGSALVAEAGAVAVFFPIDAHRPSLALGPTGDLVRKTVVKVPVSAAASASA